MIVESVGRTLLNPLYKTNSQDAEFLRVYALSELREFRVISSRSIEFSVSAM